MVWQRIFPSAGGGTMRRYLRLQSELWKKSVETDHLLKGPVTLFDFADHNDAVDAATVSVREGNWRISDDEVIGGFSRSKLSMIRTKKDLSLVMKGEDPEPIVDANGLSEVEDDFVPFVRWAGTIDTRIGEKSNVERSGFCAIQSPVYPFNGASLEGKYNALEFKCRSDGRQFLINLRVSTMFPGDLYQAVLAIPATEGAKTKNAFSRVIFPFLDFQHTLHGRIREVQRVLDGGANVERVGVTIMDGADGKFEFDLASIRAVNYYNGEILGEDDDAAPY